MNNLEDSNFVETVEHPSTGDLRNSVTPVGATSTSVFVMGRQGVSKTLSARRYSRWDYLQGIDPYTVPDKDLGSLKGVGTVFYTTGVINSPGQISSDIYRLRSRLQSLAREPLRREAAYKLKQIDIRDAKYVEEIFVTHDWLAG
jgi:hypothetical protein